jgi:hypothetical protein
MSLPNGPRSKHEQVSLLDRDEEVYNTVPRSKQQPATISTSPYLGAASTQREDAKDLPSRPIEIIKATKQGNSSTKDQTSAKQSAPISERDSIFAENYHHGSPPKDVDKELAESVEAATTRVNASVRHKHQVAQTSPLQHANPSVTHKQAKRPPKMAASPLLAAETLSHLSHLPPQLGSPSSLHRGPFDLFLYHNSTASQSPISSRPATPQSLLQRRGSSSSSFALSLLHQHSSITNDNPSDHIIALPPFASPSDSPRSRPSTPRAHTFLNTGSKIGHSNDERSRYRSWRSGLPVLGGRVTMGSEENVGDESVDKKIEATLPRAEQSTIARSRKSSHILRIFDKAEPVEVSKKESKLRHVEDVQETARRDTPEGKGPSPVTEEAEYHEKGKKLKGKERAHSIRDDTVRLPVSASTDWAQLEGDRQGSSRRDGKNASLQQQYLDEQNADLFDTSPENILSRQTTVTASDGEQDLVRKEHVTSAVYYPHRAPDQQAAERLRSPSKSRGKTIVAREDREVRIKSGKDSAVDAEDRRIELSLQSEDESQYLQGDFPSLTRASSKESESQYSQAESLASATESEGDYSEDEPAARSKSGAKAVSVATDAIELKPFSHQVGGHAAVYRVSRKAICKRVNNMENRFYETVERYHPDLLSYMPKYDDERFTLPLTVLTIPQVPWCAQCDFRISDRTEVYEVEQRHVKPFSRARSRCQERCQPV